MRQKYKDSLQSGLYDNREMKTKVKNAFVKCHSCPHLNRNGIAIASCRLASSKIVNEVLTLRTKQVREFLRSIRTINSLQIDFEKKLHTSSSEPYFYDTAYQMVNRSNVVLPIDEQGCCVTNTPVTLSKKTKRA